VLNGVTYVDNKEKRHDFEVTFASVHINKPPSHNKLSPSKKRSRSKGLYSRRERDEPKYLGSNVTKYAVLFPIFVDGGLRRFGTV
jgi:hypothetical protein